MKIPALISGAVVGERSTRPTQGGVLQANTGASIKEHQKFLQHDELGGHIRLPSRLGCCRELEARPNEHSMTEVVKDS